MAIAWAAESSDLYDDPVSGARIVQLTSGGYTSNNIYCEQPYTSPDGKRVIIARSADFCFDEVGSLLVHDLYKLKITMVEKKSVGARGVFNAAWSGLAHFWNEKRELCQVNLMTLEKKVVYVEQDPKAELVGSSVSPCQRYIVGMQTKLEGPGSPTFQLVILDVTNGTRKVIYEDDEIRNPHLQFNPVTGNEIMVQNNRGEKLLKDGSCTPAKPGLGTTLFVINRDGSNKRYLPVGQPITAGATGHEAFVADTGKVLFSVGWDMKDFYTLSHDKRFPDGNLFTARPGDTLPTVFKAPEHFFNHVCASKCGRYFVADSHGKGIFNPKTRACAAPSLVIGNLETGKYRTIVEDSKASSGGNQCRHSHPYLTADNGNVIFNADPAGTPQVYAARVTPEFLKSLD
jgi:hypothetical protein